MKWIFFLLILANGGLYLWATSATPQAGVDLPEADPGVNLGSMELVSEKAIVVGARTDCLRIGPFATRETLDNGWSLLVNHGYGLTRQRTAAREERIYQVVVGPFSSVHSWELLFAARGPQLAEAAVCTARSSASREALYHTTWTP